MIVSLSQKDYTIEDKPSPFYTFIVWFFFASHPHNTTRRTFSAIRIAIFALAVASGVILGDLSHELSRVGFTAVEFLVSLLLRGVILC